MEFAGKPYAAQVMHPSTSYEDFIEGLRPSVDPDLDRHRISTSRTRPAGTSPLLTGSGKACIQAAANPGKDVLVLIDELNRCNVSSVLGDLLLTLEASRRASFVGQDPGRASASDWQTSVPVTALLESGLLRAGQRLRRCDDEYYGQVRGTPRCGDQTTVRVFPDRTRHGQRDRATRRWRFRARTPETVATSGRMLRQLNERRLSPMSRSRRHARPVVLVRLDERVGDKVGDADVERVWRFSVVPQLIDVTRSYGAEDLLGTASRDEWFSQHGSQVREVVDQARARLAALDTFLAGLGCRILVDGTGLARGARAVDATTVASTSATRRSSSPKTASRDPRRVTVTLAAAPTAPGSGWPGLAAGDLQVAVTVSPKTWRRPGLGNCARPRTRWRRHTDLSLYETERLQLRGTDEVVEGLIWEMLGASRRTENGLLSWDSSLLAPDVPLKAGVATGEFRLRDLTSATADLLRLFDRVDLLHTTEDDLLGGSSRSPLHRPLLYRRFIDAVAKQVGDCSARVSTMLRSSDPLFAGAWTQPVQCSGARAHQQASGATTSR